MVSLLLPRRPFFWSRWVALSAGFVVNSLNLYVYAFGLFSNALKEDLGFSQRGTDLVASFGELGLWSSFLVGLLFERVGARGTYCSGALITLFGLGYVALATAGALPGNVAAVAAGFALANFGSSCFGMTAQTVAVRNFPPADRGKVSGTIKSIFGLSSAVIGVLYEGLFGRNVDPSSYLLLLSLLVPLVGVLTAPFINLIPKSHASSYALERAQGLEPSLKPFYAWLGVAFLFLGSATISMAAGAALPRPWTGVALLMFVASALLLPLRYGRTWVRLERSFGGETDVEDDGLLGLAKEVVPLLSDDQDESFAAAEGEMVLDGRGEAAETASNGRRNRQEDGSLPEAAREEQLSGGVSVKKDLTWRQCLRDTRFYVLWGAFMCGAGAGTTVINNVASIADSLGLAHSNALVTALGLANATGRFVSGVASDRVVAAGLPRAAAMVVALAASVAVSLMLAIGAAPLLYPLAVGAGLCYGSMFTLTLAICGDLFGTTHLGPNYGLLDLGPAAGSFIFAAWITSYFYGKGDGNDDGGESESECAGAKCFRGTFLCTAAACAIAAAVVFGVLVWGGRRRRKKAAAAGQPKKAKRTSLGYL